MPIALACGFLEDGGRILTLTRRSASGGEYFEVPCALLYSGDDPVAALVDVFRKSACIDAEVHEVLFQRQHNCGSRKRKKWISALVFKVTAKERVAKPAVPYVGFKWIPLKDVGKYRFSRDSEWMRPK
ncbi:Uncharacterised protein [uncultured archaeon]|nr:Uncharacterised protein [uncultured archaeon]